MMELIRKRLKFINLNLKILTIRQVMGMFFRRMVMPYASLFILAVGGDATQVGLVNSLQPFAGLFMFPISGYLTDRTGRVKLIALANLLSALTMLLYVFAPSWQWIALGALIQGFMVFQFPPTSAILADSIEPQNRGVGIATMNTLATAFSILSPYVAGLIVEFYGDNFGIRILYLFLVVVQIFGAILVYRYLQETYTAEKQETRSSIATILREAYGGIPELLRNLPRSVKALAVLLGMGFIANGVSSPFWVVYTTEVIGISKIDWGLILLLESILKTILTIPFGIIADRYSRTKTLLVAILFSLISIPTIIFAKTFVHVLLIRFGIGIAGSLLMPTSVALMADYIPREMRGRTMAAIGRGAFMVGAAGGGTGGPGMGYIFTLPVMASSIIGGILYTRNPMFPWFVVLGAIVIQLLSLVLFIRDPVNVER